jgi:hypothetical protein
MKKTFFTTFVILFLQIITAQEQKMDCATVNVSQPVSNFQYLKYDNNFVIKKYDKFSEVTNKTEEELMRSILSASDLNWFNFNREKKVEKTSQDFGYIKSVNNNIYYIKLLNKINFVANGIEYAVIKFHLYDNDNIYGFAEAMKKINGKWVSTSDSQTTMLLFFMGMIKTSYIDAIMKKHNTDNQALNKIIQSSTKNEKIDFNAIIHNINNELPNNNKLKNIYDENRIFK